MRLKNRFNNRINSQYHFKIKILNRKFKSFCIYEHLRTICEPQIVELKSEKKVKQQNYQYN